MQHGKMIATASRQHNVQGAAAEVVVAAAAGWLGALLYRRYRPSVGRWIPDVCSAQAPFVWVGGLGTP
jgi:hypothetical protein